MITPVFLFSLPRSGSTLIQRLLATHPQVATASEPWLLLPLLYAVRRPGVVAEYGHRTAVRALDDFFGQLPAGREAYLEEVRGLARSLYRSAAGDGARYFLDKTPRYHLIADDIMELFPDGRFLFVWRQPLAVAASMIESFGSGRWNLERYEVDVLDGLENLIAAARPNDPRCLHLRFEDVVADPDGELARMLTFLELDPADADAAAFDRTVLTGRMGDRTGVVDYREVSTEPLDKWRTTMSTWYRRRWCRRYLRRLGPARLEFMGYDAGELEREVEQLDPSPRHLGSDLARSAYGRGRLVVARRLMYPGERELEKRAARRREMVKAP
jgi:hypothetical protein